MSELVRAKDEILEAYKRAKATGAAEKLEDAATPTVEDSGPPPVMPDDDQTEEYAVLRL